MPASSFVLLAWMHYHAKLDYVTYFLYQELEEQFISYQSFLNQLNSALSGHDQSCYNKFHLIDFVEDYYNSKGALLVPLCQYAKFLLLLKTNTAKMFTALLKLFYISKQDIMKQVLTYYTNLETIKLREYLRQLPWNKLFEEAQSI